MGVCEKRWSVSPKKQIIWAKNHSVWAAPDVFFYVLVTCFNSDAFLKCKGVEWNFLASALTLPLSLQSEAVDKLTFRSAAKNLTHGLDLLSLNLLTYNQQNKTSSQQNYLEELL